MKSWGILYLMR